MARSLANPRAKEAGSLNLYERQWRELEKAAHRRHFSVSELAREVVDLGMVALVEREQASKAAA